jgi:hypothetical protein
VGRSRIIASQPPTGCSNDVRNASFAASRRAPEIGVGRNGDSAFEIVRILVVGIDRVAGIRTVRPSAYFSLFGVKEYAV